MISPSLRSMKTFLTTTSSDLFPAVVLTLGVGRDHSDRIFHHTKSGLPLQAVLDPTSTINSYGNAPHCGTPLVTPRCLYQRASEIRSSDSLQLSSRHDFPTTNLLKRLTVSSGCRAQRLCPRFAGMFSMRFSTTFRNSHASHHYCRYQCFIEFCMLTPTPLPHHFFQSNRYLTFHLQCVTKWNGN